jgi:PTS system mannose-specific IIC component
MFGMSVFQVVAILLVVVIATLDTYGPQSLFFYQNIPTGLIIGFILGDWQQGLYIGSAVALMSLGVIGAGGASIPSYFMTTVVTTIVAIQSGVGYEVGLAVGIPVGMLNIYLDVLIKTALTFFANKSEEYVEKGEYEKGMRICYVGMFFNILQYVIPLCVVIFAGQAITQAIVDFMPAWLYSGLTVAGKLLPAVGLSALLNFMPIKKHFPYLIIGYVMAAYFGSSTLAVSLIGIALAFMFYQNQSNRQAVVVEGDMEDE